MENKTIKGLLFSNSLNYTEPNFDSLPPITEEDKHQSDNFFVPITVSTKSKRHKTTSEQEGMSWKTLHLNPWQLIDKLKKNHIYSGSMFKPFTQSHPEKGYKKYDFSAQHGFGGMFTSYFHLFSTSIISIDVDGFRTDKSLEQIYNVLRYYNCNPTFLYSTSSDKTNKETGVRDDNMRHFRLLYWLDQPIYACPIVPIYDKETEHYIWDDKEDTRARRAANYNYSCVCNKIIRDLEYAYFELANRVDRPASFTSTTRYNGNPKSNFEVVGDFHILHTLDYISDEVNQPYEPIENFKSQKYIECIKIPKELAAAKQKEANAKVMKHLEQTKKISEHKEPLVNSESSIFDLGELKLIPIETQKYELLKNYELILYYNLPPKVPENDRLVLAPKEFKECSIIDNMFKTSTLKRDVYINNVQFLEDYADKTKSFFELFCQYKDYYPNRWQTHQIAPFAPNKKFPKFGYKVIYKTLPWQFSPLKHHNSVMRIAVKRKDQMKLLSIGRRIIDADITYDNLLFNSLVDFMFLTKNNDGDVIKREDISKVVSYVWNLNDDHKSWKYVDDMISRKPSNKAVKEKRVMEIYNANPELKYDDLRNLLLVQYDISISDKTLRRILSANGIKKYNTKNKKDAPR